MQVILSHVAADFDAVSSMVAVQKLYPEAVMVFTGEPESVVREFMTLHRGLFKVEKARNINPAEVTRAIVVDTRNPARLGPFRQRMHERDLEVHIYDHHPATPDAIRGDLEVIEPLGAAVTVVLKRVLERGLEISSLEATLFLLGLYEETGSLTFPSTTAEDLHMAARMVELGGNLSLIPRFVRVALSPDQIGLFETLLHNVQVRQVRGYAVAMSTATTDRFIGELGMLTHRLLELEQTDLALAVVRMRDRTYAVGRSRDENLNVGRVLRRMGGGGHATAASASLSGPLEEVVPRLWQLLEKYLPHNLTARDLMTSEVVCLEMTDATTVDEALEELRRLSHTALVVRVDGRVVGMIARSDLDKAIAHKLGHAPVKSFMSSPILSIPPEATLDEIQRLLVERDVGRLPVMRDEELLGIVSRTDILRAVYNQTPIRPARSQATPNSTRLLRLPTGWLDLLRTAGDVARDMGLEAYAVGGFVRDLLLYGSGPRMDVDLVVEGPGLDYARQLAERLGAEVRLHERFQTANLYLPDGRHLDVATARTETYCRPAALPVVSGSTLKQDLFRRDFSINALAMRLIIDHFGDIVDFFGARQDLDSGVIRILHNHSFYDDPIRILRAIRFEQRLQFHLDPTTEHLLRNAVSQGLLGQATPERVRDEFLACLAEPEPQKLLRRLDQLKIVRAINPHFRLDQRTNKTLDDVDQALVRLRPWLGEVEHWKLYLRVLVSRLTPEQAEELSRTYKLRLPDSRADFPALIRLLSRQVLPPSLLVDALAPLSAEEMVYLAALGTRANRVSDRMEEYLDNWREVTPMVTGRHLKEWGYAPSPAFRPVLTSLWHDQLDSRFQTLEEARTLAEQRFAEHTTAGSPADSVEPSLT